MVDELVGLKGDVEVEVEASVVLEGPEVEMMVQVVEEEVAVEEL